MPEPSFATISAVLECPIPVHGTWPDCGPLLAVVGRGVGARGAVLVSSGRPSPEAVVAGGDVPDADVAALAAGTGAVLAAADAASPVTVGDVHLPAVVRVPGRSDSAVAAVGSVEGDHAGMVLRVAAERVGAALEAGRLRADLERAMAQVLESDERLLSRIGLDIHDGPTQHLSVALLELQLLDADLAEADPATLPESLKPALERVYETLGGALTEMRELIGHLRPAQFENRRLADILNDAIVGFETRSGASVTTDMQGEFAVNGVSITQRITFYRILQEALGNAHRHGHARNAHVTVVEDETGVLMEVRDDGVGFDAEHAMRPRDGAPIARFGLHGMRDRAQVLGGTFALTSVPGEGTTVRVFLPRWMPPSDEGR
ncbi:MAG: sensor histidine kinase [Thermoleophilia bacterium]|nr:sensor histidine kinase [Thermoleophilia bacterium]